MNPTTQHLAKHLHGVFFGGNWTDSNLKMQLKDVTWQQSTLKFEDLNSIATLVYHINYFIEVASRVLEGGPLEGKDTESFNHPPIKSEDDWNQFTSQVFTSAEHFSNLIKEVPEELLWQDFKDPKYGNYYRNIQGIIEHTHYHLGQIALLKKMIQVFYMKNAK